MVYSWFDFLFIILFINLSSFVFLYTTFLNILIICELFWIIIYIYFSILSIQFNSIIIFLTGIYILCIATSETTIGLSILVLKWNLFGSINNFNILNVKNLNLFNKTKINLINSKINKKYK